MKRILVLGLLTVIYFSVKAQENIIVLSNLSVNDRPQQPLDPSTGKICDTIPNLYQFTVMVNNLRGAVSVHLSLSTSSDAEGKEVYSNVFPIVEEYGVMVVKSNRFAEQIRQLPLQSSKANPLCPAIMLVIPVELSKQLSSQWKRCNVFIEMIDRSITAPIQFNK